MNISKAISTIIALTLLISFRYANAQYVTWSRYYGGDYGDGACSVIPLQDGGFGVFGGTFSFGSGMYDYYLIRTDSLGNLEWSETYGAEGQDMAQSFDYTSDGGYILAGSRNHYPGNRDMYVVKVDSLGNLEWEALYGAIGDYNDYCESVRQTVDGGYVLAGYSNSSTGGSNTDVLLIKIDEFGDVQWETMYGGERTDECYDVEETHDEGYFLSGITYPAGTGYPKYYAIKTDSNGIAEWEVIIGGDKFDKCLDAVQVADGGFVLAGYSDSFSESYNDIYIVKLDSTGATVWEQIVDNNGFDDQARHISNASDQGLIICGVTSLPGDHPQGYVVKMDIDGFVVWDLMYGGSDNDFLNCIEETAEGQFVSAGNTSSWGPGGYNVWLIQIESEVSIASGRVEAVVTDDNTLTVYPNPVHGSVVNLSYFLQNASAVSIDIYDINGHMVCTLLNGVQESGYHSTIWTADNGLGNTAPNGIYFVSLRTDESYEVQSVLILE